MQLSVQIDNASRIDWFGELKRSLGHESRTLSQSMLYTGPAIGQVWRVMTQRVGIFKSHQQVSIETVTEMLRASARPSQLIDLGVGTFAKSHHILSALLDAPATDPLSYVALDLSMQILVDALEDSENLGIAERLRGSGGCVGGVLANMARIGYILPHLPKPDGPRAFLLLGNTLGNIDDHVGLLRRIGDAMNSDDSLIVELQMPSKNRATAADLDKYCADTKVFYGSPFLAIGMRPESFSVKVVNDTDTAGQAVQSIACQFHEKQVSTHPGFGEEPVSVLKGHSVNVTLVRRYVRESAIALGQEAGFEVSIETPETSDNQRFAYLLLRRPHRDGVAANTGSQRHSETLSPTPSEDTLPDAYNPSFTTLRWKGIIYRFDEKESRIVQSLWEACRRQEPLSNAQVAEEAGVEHKESFRVERVFKTHPAYKNQLIAAEGAGRARRWKLSLAATASKDGSLM